ncbi:MAG: hypothetical protein JXA66_04600, partial [Oligoflexia bacterium]|nr:hypothetical protein [Oligoflexia bacterium]
ILSAELEKEAGAKGKRVLKITFGKGNPGHVSTESFEFYFTELCRNTVLEGAELVYNEVNKEGFFVESIETED